MKKVVSLLLALVLMVGLLSTAVFAEEGEDYDVIRFEKVLTKQSDNGLFTLTANSSDDDGWFCDGSDTLTITAAKGLTITRIEAEISYHYYSYGEVGVSGTAFKEKYPEKDGDTVTVSNINSSEFSFTGGTEYIQLKDITVYYTGTHTHDYQPTVYTCQSCGKEAPAGYVPEVPGGSTASTLSQGNMTIVVGVACAAVFGFGGFLLGKKKKPAAASGANSEDEE